MSRKKSRIITVLTLMIICGLALPPVWSDPLMSPRITLTEEGTFGEYPDVAYNTIFDQYLVVWQADSGQGLRGRFVSSRGEVAGDPFEITSPYQSDGMPRVAYDISRNRYLVVWNRGGAGGHMYGRFIPGNGPDSALNEFIIETTVHCYGEYSVAYSTVQDEFLVVWVTKYTSPSTYFPTVGRRVYASGSGFPGSTFFVANHPPDNRSWPDVAYNPVRNEYLVSTHDYPRVNDNVYGVRVTGAGTVLTESVITTWSDEEAFPAVAACPIEDQYLVVWDSIQTSLPSPYPEGVYARFIAGDGTLGSVNQIVHWSSWDDGTLVDVASGMTGLLLEDPRYLVVYKRSYDLWGRELFPSGTMYDAFQIAYYSGRPAVAGGPINFLVSWAGGGVNARIVGNTKPRACFRVLPEQGDSRTDFTFDASCSTDTTHSTSNLQVRWDWNHDDTYDTTWSATKTITHRFALLPWQYIAVFNVQMQVTDGQGETDTVTGDVIVYRSPVSAMPAIYLLLLLDE